MSEDNLVHGKELDTALENSLGPNSLRSVICDEALRTRTDAIIESQLEELESEKTQEEIRKGLMEAGRPFTDEDVYDLNLRAVISSSFSLGICIGLEVQRMREAGEA